MLQILVILFAIGTSAAFLQSVTSEAQLDSSQCPDPTGAWAEP